MTAIKNRLFFLRWLAMGKKNKKRKQRLHFEDSAIQQLARQWHYQIFPEEYDHMLDSGVDAKERARGINPMSSEYTESVNRRRIQLGFQAYSGKTNSNVTYEWIQDKILAHQELELQKIADWVKTQ